MSEIRRSVVKDKTLSVYAHNVKIISKGGMVTLKGPVHSDDEKKNIEAKAVAVAGDGNVTDQITGKRRFQVVWLRNQSSSNFSEEHLYGRQEYSSFLEFSPHGWPRNAPSIR